MDVPAHKAEMPRLPNPAPLMQLALAHRSSAVLFAAADLDVFTVLATGAKTHDEVAQACGAKPAPMRMLLEACAAEGLLTVAEDRYANAPLADAFLVRGRPAFSAHQFKYAEDLYPAWGKLATLVRTGQPPMAPETILGEDKAKTRAFVLAMHERARGIGSVLPHLLDLNGRQRLLDVGGGPGTYSVAMVRETPGLTATVLDVPGVLEVTRELIASSGVQERIELRPGNYLTDDFGTGYDVALLSGMMHRETPASCTGLLRKACAALQPGGLVIVSDVFFDDDTKRTPLFTVYFALNMMLTSNEGSAHAKTEMAAWMRDVGFVDVQVRNLPPPNPHSLVVGLRP
jgi:predicted O-methyltransferase YrrM